MSDEEITYATVKFHKSSSGLQNEGRPDEAKGPTEAGHRESSVPWNLIAIPLGIFCSILLVTIAVLVTCIFQYRQEKQEQKKILNDLNQKYDSLKNDSSLKEKMLKNMSIDYDALKGRLDSINKECYAKTKITLDCSKFSDKYVGHWFCRGIKCYFLMDNKNWHKCKKTCEDCTFSILNIEDNDELAFLKAQLDLNKYWIGLKYDLKNWQWVGDSPCKLDLSVIKLGRATGGCAFLSSIGTQDYDCYQRLGCICEKRVEKCSQRKGLSRLQKPSEELEREDDFPKSD
uniref:killer cell lectin-like receptor 2 n=1 Tax=Myodes glareolus TaxID=447135 RepID=UPI0020221760|nr:killer cell lectin-like receptor 2 [Myodes glareolus]